MLIPTTSYATDEDIAIRASSDFLILCPKDQRLAWGTDGAFAAGSPWALTSATADFLGNGVATRNLVHLTQPVTSFKPPGELFAVASVSTGLVGLRRKGQQAGVGQPPCGPAGLGQVEFCATTLGPQIERASYDLNRRYGIDDLVAGRRSCDLFDPREVREAVVLTVLYRQYLEMSRGSDERADNFASKARLYKEELDDLLARTVVHWGTSQGVPSSAQSTSRMNMRITR